MHNDEVQGHGFEGGAHLASDRVGRLLCKHATVLTPPVTLAWPNEFDSWLTSFVVRFTCLPVKSYHVACCLV